MKSQPFAIKSMPAGDAYWVVVPSQDMDSVQLGLDIGGGEGPVVANVEWIRSATMKEGGFLYWTIQDQTQVTAPTWLPAGLEASIRDMAQALLSMRHLKQSEA